MKVLGLRVDPKGARYALVERDGQTYELLNSESENRLIFPANVKESIEKADWLFAELERLFREHKDISRVCIKTNEYTQNDSKRKRESAYLEGVIILFCAQKKLPLDIKIYASLGAKSSDVKMHAENRVGKTQKYWDTKMADAVVAAWKVASS